MKNKIILEIPKLENIILELDDKTSPKTVKSLLDSLPFSVGINLWGEEIYTDETPITMTEENAKPVVELNDVAYWPTGKAICLFYGSTPIGKKGEIKPYSPVNVIGKIVTPDKSILSKIKDGTIASFKKNN
ncbi:MAG TPA: cyclophilin-like fold protein [Nitrosopumilaceae archaeon]|nr:cyclophilin-like fold protein [Nitrosopumilaceae archaeon]